jgi:hypothetical protein
MCCLNVHYTLRYGFSFYLFVLHHHSAPNKQHCHYMIISSCVCRESCERFTFVRFVMLAAVPRTTTEPSSQRVILCLYLGWIDRIFTASARCRLPVVVRESTTWITSSYLPLACRCACAAANSSTDTRWKW